MLLSCFWLLMLSTETEVRRVNIFKFLDLEKFNFYNCVYELIKQKYIETDGLGPVDKRPSID